MTRTQDGPNPRESSASGDMQAASGGSAGALPSVAVQLRVNGWECALDIDPVDLRLINDTDIDTELGVPLTGRRLADCLREGARRFGWDTRPKTPASRREGRHLIGYGVASAIRMHFQGPTEASVRVEADGRVIVKSDMTDIGTGAAVSSAVFNATGIRVRDFLITMAKLLPGLPAQV